MQEMDDNVPPAAIGGNRAAATRPERRDVRLEAGRTEDRPNNGRDDGRDHGKLQGQSGRHRKPANRKDAENARGNAPAKVYGALDLGTNNCRLLVARPTRRGFLVIDAFSRIIRLGEGVTQHGRLSEAAMSRTVDALRVCADKIRRRGVKRARLVATEACRIAENGDEFIERVYDQTGLTLEVLDREAEAKLAVCGCASLIDRRCNWTMVFDIGGGSSELIWLDLSKLAQSPKRSLPDRMGAQHCIAAWTSLPVGVVTLAERFGGRLVDRDVFEAMVEAVLELLRPFEARHQFRNKIDDGNVHMLGTSGTVTTVAGVYLGLERYDRRRVDGCWMAVDDARHVADSLVDMNYNQRIAQPCIGTDRADLVLGGCAILEALVRMWPCKRLRVADRGLREGILATLMAEDGIRDIDQRRRSNRSRRPRQ